jgi:heterodisulfide reductase subunit A
MKQLQTKSQAEVERCWPSIEKVAPCQNACPLNVDVPGYVMAVTHGNLDKALAIVTENNPLPAICGRVCHHPCEDSCLRAKIDEPIAIKSLKRFIIDHTPKLAVERLRPVKKTREERVAIIGSGPAGLAAAHDLARQGYPVTVFETAPQAGGLLRYGIPEYRLPNKIVDDEISYVEELGVEIKTNTPVKNLKDVLGQGYKAVFLATGAWASQKMGIPNEDTKGVIHALDFLKKVTSGVKVSLGQRVAVIGGGNAAVDAARVAQRLGAKEVSIVYRRSRAEMPAIETEVEEAEREGVKLHILAAPVRVLTENDWVTGVECIRMELGEPDASGRRRPIPINGSEFNMAVDNVIMAIGQAVDKAMLPKELEYTSWGTVSVDPVTLQTNVESVFAGGDIVNVATVVEAIAAGKKAAMSIDRYLKGLDLKEGRLGQAIQVVAIDEENTPRFVEPRERRQVPMLPLGERLSSFNEVELGFAHEAATEEAKRCLNCPVCGNCVFGRAQMCYETATRLL